MFPSGLALWHPVVETLLQYATYGCPVNTGKPWTKQQTWAVVKWGPHASALVPNAIDQQNLEVQDKIWCGWARVVEWDSMKDDLPWELKIFPISMVPHKLWKYWAILDLSFAIQLKMALMFHQWMKCKSKWLHGAPSFKLATPCPEKSMHLHLPQKTKKYLWLSGTSRMAFGKWTAK